MLTLGIGLKKMKKSYFFDFIGLCGFSALAYGLYLELGLGKSLICCGSLLIVAAIAKNWGDK